MPVKAVRSIHTYIARGVRIMIVVALLLTSTGVSGGVQAGGIKGFQPPPLQSLDPQTRLTQYVHDQWDDESGLPGNTINAITQTPDGYLWVGTSAGLVRYNGAEFAIFNRSNTEAFGGSYDIKTLTVGASGHLWIGTAGGGLVRHDGEAFVRYGDAQGLTGRHVEAVQVKADSTLLIGTLDAGAFRFNGRTFERISGDINMITALHTDSAGTVWVGTGQGLFQLRDDSLEAVRMGAFQGQPIRYIGVDAEGHLLVSTRSQIFQYTDGRAKTPRYISDDLNTAVFDTWADDQGSLWMGTDGAGLVRYNEAGLDVMKERRGLGEGRIHAIFQDREGSLWVGTEGRGLHRLRNSSFTTITTRENLSEDMVLTVYEDSRGVLWAGTEGGGLNRIEDGKATAVYTTEDGLPSDVVLSIQEDARGHLWVGTYGGGVSRMERGRFVQPEAEMPMNAVYAMHMGSSGTLWMGTDVGVMGYVDGRGIVSYADRWDASIKDISTMHEDQNGTLWIGTFPSGLYRVRDGHVESFGIADGLPASVITDIHEVKPGVLWLSTHGDGIVLYRNGMFTSFTTYDGLFSDTVYQIMEDQWGNLWMGSNRGVFRADMDELIAYAEGEATSFGLSVFDESDGLRNDELNGGVQPAGWKGQDGTLWFPTAEGVAGISPDHIIQNEVPPLVMIESVKIDGKTTSMAEAISLSTGSHKISMRFAASSFIAPEHVRFRYKLEGYDEEWIETQDRTTTYTNLSPGAYTFHVEAQNADGKWSKQAALLSFEQQPSLYHYPIFWVVCVVGVLASIASVHRFLVRLHVRRRQFLESVVESRTHELREAKNEAEVAREKAEEMNRLKSAFLANMSHEIRTPLTSIIGFSEVIGEEPSTVERFAYQIEQSGRRLLRTLNSVLELAQLQAGTMTLDAESIDLAHVAQSTLSEFELSATRKGLKLRTNIPVRPVYMMLDQAATERIIANLVSNAIKFTENGHVTVGVHVENEGVRLTVADSGVGIGAEFIEQLFEEFQQESTGAARIHEGSGLGLAITQRLIQMMGGTISVDSVKGKGTTFTIFLPGEVRLEDEAAADTGDDAADARRDGAARAFAVVDLPAFDFDTPSGPAMPPVRERIQT